MNLSVYKPGQGYWVRVMSAVLGALLTVALAAWVYGQMQILADRLPKTGYSVGFEADQPGAFAVGDSVELASAPDSTGAAAPVGTATVSSIDTGEKRLIIVNNFKPAVTADGKPAADFTSTKQIRKTAADAKSIKVQSVAGISPVDPTILGGGAAAAIIIGGALVAYWLIGLRPRTVEFLIATDFEMKKVNWSTPREIMGHTWVVIGACVLLATALFLVDIALKVGFTAIQLLPKVQGK